MYQIKLAESGELLAGFGLEEPEALLTSTIFEQVNGGIEELKSGMYRISGVVYGDSLDAFFQYILEE